MELRGTLDRHALLEGMNLPMLGLGVGTALVAIVIAAIGTAIILRNARGSESQGKVLKWARIAWVGFVFYLVAYIGYFVHKSSPEKVSYPFVPGDRLVAKGDYNGAIKFYAGIAKEYPDMALAHFKLGMALRMVKAIGPSVKELKLAIRDDPDQPEPYFALGSILWTQGTSQDAMPYFRKGLELDPQNRQKGFFMQIIHRGELEQKGQLKAGSEARPRLSPAAPASQVGMP
ncbi:MAG: tetratricopeptide repeat protein [Leptospirales bacterium]